MATDKTRRGLLAKIHVGKVQLGWTDDVYRAVLWEQCRADSSKDLTVRELESLVAFMVVKGFRPTTPPRAGARRAPKGQLKRGKDDLLAKIGALLAEADRPWAYAHGIAKHMFKVDTCQWCDAEQVRKIVAALMYDAKRHRRQTA